MGRVGEGGGEGLQGCLRDVAAEEREREAAGLVRVRVRAKVRVRVRVRVRVLVRVRVSEMPRTSASGDCTEGGSWQ